MGQVSRCKVLEAARKDKEGKALREELQGTQGPRRGHPTRGRANHLKARSLTQLANES